MAINLWTQVGGSTNYNPLPVSIAYSLKNIGDYVISFRAKSTSGSRIRVTNWFSIATITKTVNLTSDFVQYSFSFNQPTSQNIAFYDVDSKDDIIIQDIQLVEKPMGVATINGVDGFNSGKWTLHANAKVIDDETLELNATDVDQATKLVLKVQPNTFYSVSIDTGVDSRIRIGKDDGGTVVDGVSWGTSIKSVYSKGQSTFVTDSSTTSITVILTNDIAGTFTFKRPMLNLGSTPAPYEPKRGERMVIPVAKKNLIQVDVNQWEQGTFGDFKTNVPSTTRIRGINNFPLVFGKTYIASCSNEYEVVVNRGEVNTVFGNPITFVADGTTGRLAVRKIDSTNITPSEIVNVSPQLEEGSTATPYEPYSVQINKKPNKRQQLYSWMDNFVGKVSGSEVENPHVSKVTDNASLLAPSIFIAEINGGGTAYPQISSLGNGNYFRSVNTNTLIAQHLFSFNLIELVKRKLGYDVPGATTADKVAWLKDNVSKITCSWHGFGSSVGGNKASLSVWNAVTISYTDTITHTSSSVTRLGLGIATPPTIANRIDVNGFIHFLAYAEPSDGVTASTINTDYVELLVDTKPIVNLLDSGVLNSVQMKSNVQVRQALR